MIDSRPRASPLLVVLFTALALCFAPSVRSEIAVEILNMPTEVYSFEPVYVLYAVENTGESPVYLPAEGAPTGGPGVYCGPVGEPLRVCRLIVLGDRAFPLTMNTMWLAPGERWLFYEDIASELGVLEGEMSIQAVMSSRDRCGDRQVGGRQSFSLNPLFLETLRTGVARAGAYKCWQGEVRSNLWSLTVKRSTAPIDRVAHDFVLRQHGSGLSHDPQSGRWRFMWVPGLEERFPASHYAYAQMAGDGSSVLKKMKAVELQPNNPLNPWVMGAIARDVLDHRSSCWGARRLTFDLSIKDLALPTGVREYLDQYAWYLENLHCPRVVKESKAKAGGRKP